MDDRGDYRTGENGKRADDIRFLTPKGAQAPREADVSSFEGVDDDELPF